MKLAEATLAAGICTEPSTFSTQGTAGLWERRFGRDPAVIGRTLMLDGTPHAVVGVAGRSGMGAEHLAYAVHSSSVSRE